jgi:hypothetical protein
MPKDVLFEIFKKHLNQIDPDTQGVQDLVYEVVGDYMAHLMKQGHIPQNQMDILETDLREEVLEIYRKVTYGHLNLKSYKQAQQQKTKTKLSRSS